MSKAVPLEARATQNNKMYFEAKHLEMTNCLSFHQIILELTDMASTQMPKNWTKISRYDKLNYFVHCDKNIGCPVTVTK